MKPTLTLILILFALSVEAQALNVTRLTIITDSTRVDVGAKLAEIEARLDAIDVNSEPNETNPVTHTIIILIVGVVIGMLVVAVIKLWQN